MNLYVIAEVGSKDEEFNINNIDWAIEDNIDSGYIEASDFESFYNEFTKLIESYNITCIIAKDEQFDFAFRYNCFKYDYIISKNIIFSNIETQVKALNNTLGLAVSVDELFKYFSLAVNVNNLSMVNKLVQFISTSKEEGKNLTEFVSVYATIVELVSEINNLSDLERELICKILNGETLDYTLFKKVILEKRQLSILENMNTAELEEEINKNLPIGRHVKACFRYLEAIGFTFTDVELSKFLTKNGTFDILGVSLGSSMLSTIKNRRYWKHSFVFNDNIYYINSNWMEYQRSRFDTWFKRMRERVCNEKKIQ